MSGEAHVLSLSQPVPVEQARRIAAQLSALPEVEYAEPDYILHIANPAMVVPNDPAFALQWHYSDTFGIDLPQGWAITTGVTSTVVAVIDTGHRPHVDLVSRIVGGYDFISSVVSAGDGDGRDSNPEDPGDWSAAGECGPGSPAKPRSSWHGTHVAGTIGAVTNNGQGVAGVNWRARLLSVRVLGKCGGTVSDIADAIRWSAGLNVSGVPTNPNPARVLNLSLGGNAPTCPSTLQSAISQAVGQGAVVVVAAGNSSSDAIGTTPANCSGVIVVGATNKSGHRASYSNFGWLIDISAPGGDSSGGVLSTYNNGAQLPDADTYASLQGTSMATPHVAGVASLMLAISPTLTPAQVETVLKDTAKPFGPGHTCAGATSCGAGIVSAYNALEAVLAPPSPFGKSAPSNNAVGQPISLTLTWQGAGGVVNHYRYCLTTNASCTPDVNVGTMTSATVSNLSPGATYVWQVRACANSTCTKFTDANGGQAWSFTTLNPPSTFGKSVPLNGASSGPSNNLTLSWETSLGTHHYRFCAAKHAPCVPDVNIGTMTSVYLSGLDRGATYFWQVRACADADCTVFTDADGGDVWSFNVPAYVFIPLVLSECGEQTGE